MLTAVLRSVERQRLQQAVRFWRMYTTCCICQRLQLQLPTFPHACGVFDTWLWQHERWQYTKQQAVQLAGRLAVVRCFGESWAGAPTLPLIEPASGCLLNNCCMYAAQCCGMAMFTRCWSCGQPGQACSCTTGRSCCGVQ